MSEDLLFARLKLQKIYSCFTSAKKKKIFFFYVRGLFVCAVENKFFFQLFHLGIGPKSIEIGPNSRSK